jgi:hypothetical protein
MENDNVIVPGERVGIYRLDWDVETLIKHLPANYIVERGNHYWYVMFGYFTIGVRKIDQVIDFITIKNVPDMEFKETFKGKIIGNYTLGEIEEEFGETQDWTWFFTLPNYPGMECYYDDEEEGEDEDSWKYTKIKHIAICHPNFVWDEHFSLEDYARMERDEFSCPFPKERMVSSRKE